MGQEDRTERIQKAEAFFESKLRRKLEPLYMGQYVAIDPDSEEYFVGNSVKEACLSGVKKHPNRKLVCLRVGYPATRFVGSHA